MKATDIVNLLLADKSFTPGLSTASAYAPTNIALCKYWGKRNFELNLPVTSSLSIALPNKGTTTKLSLNDNAQDMIALNGNLVSPDTSFAKRLSTFLDLFRQQHDIYFNIDTTSNIPIAAGLASSASGFAALVKALDTLFSWQLNDHELSILARLGSGSACRSLWNGFVRWDAGKQEDGMDCFASPMEANWPELRIGLLILEANEKPISSREAMEITTKTAAKYQYWPNIVVQDMATIASAIIEQNINLLGQTAESNALAMHDTMLDAKPSIEYCTQETLAARQEVKSLRAQGCPVYFTQDAGPNLKLLFTEENTPDIKTHFNNVEIITPFC